MLPTPESTLDIPVILDVVDVEIPPLQGLDILDRNNLFVNNVINHLLNRIVTNKHPPRFEDIWKIKLTRKDDHLYVLLCTTIHLFITMAKLRKLHKQFAHPSST